MTIQWNVSLLYDVFDLSSSTSSYMHQQHHKKQQQQHQQHSFEEHSSSILHNTNIIHISCPIESFMTSILNEVIIDMMGNNDSANDAMKEAILHDIMNNRIAQIALSDFLIRWIYQRFHNSYDNLNFIAASRNDSNNNNIETAIPIRKNIISLIEPLDQMTSSTSSSSLHLKLQYHQNIISSSTLLLKLSSSITEPMGIEKNNNNNVDDVEFHQKKISSSKKKKKNSNHTKKLQQRQRNNTTLTPYILERTDVCCYQHHIHIYLRCYTYECKLDIDHNSDATNSHNHDKETTMAYQEQDINTILQQNIQDWLHSFFVILRSSSLPDPSDCVTNTTTTSTLSTSALLFPIYDLMNHIGVCILQEKMRKQLKEYNSIAFIANESILPRKSGINLLPMSSPPAIPFQAPIDSTILPRISYPINIGVWKQYINFNNTNYQNIMKEQQTDNNIITISGLLIPNGITLIVGGGYHGKSTLLRCIAIGIYNKIIGDGRELCVTCSNAVSIRAEDGRYVNNCNISGFISNLPIMVNNDTSNKTNNESLSSAATSAITTATDIADDDTTALTNETTTTTTTPIFDTKHFSTNEASGSTSQATNVIEAIEMGCTTLLIDEDISAANFMARDGRMRSLIMDESITPLLYRVNGLYQELNISSIVVVGGVGDWLDVPNHVILLDKYICYDATLKAKSISKQFSHGHVEYGGRGVVHRLPWDISSSPLPRKPNIILTTTPNHLNTTTEISDKSSDDIKPLMKKQKNVCIVNGKYLNITSTAVTLLDGTNTISIHHSNEYDANIEKVNDPNMHYIARMTVDGNCDEDSDDSDMDDDDDDDERYIDLSRCEQLIGKKPQLYGCGICVVWILHMARIQYPDLSISELLLKLDSYINEYGYISLFMQYNDTTSSNETTTTTNTWKSLIECIGYSYRPRLFEIGQALTRLRGITFNNIQDIMNEIEMNAKQKANDDEMKKQNLLDIWNNRRKANNMKHVLEQEINNNK